MPRFFCENFEKDRKIVGSDAVHISKSLRMKIGEKITVCDTKGIDYYCEISQITAEEIYLNILSEKENDTEPDISVTLFQCMPKGDKLDYIVQKSVELGVSEIVPVISSRCISRPDAKSAAKKTARLNKISDEAAKQSGRGILPTVSAPINFDECLNKFALFDKVIIFYELGGKPLNTLIDPTVKKIAIFIGPEGGISAEEFDKATNCGACAATLGKRILRTETAPIAALSNIMLLSGNMQ